MTLWLLPPVPPVPHVRLMLGRCRPEPCFASLQPSRPRLQVGTPACRTGWAGRAGHHVCSPCSWIRNEDSSFGHAFASVAVAFFRTTVTIGRKPPADSTPYSTRGEFTFPRLLSIWNVFHIGSVRYSRLLASASFSILPSLSFSRLSSAATHGVAAWIASRLVAIYWVRYVASFCLLHF